VHLRFRARPAFVGRPHRVGEQADIYSLGAILFEILTGDSLHPRRRADAVQSTLDGAEARPSVRRPELGIEPELDRILQRATARHPGDRYPSARALANDMEAFLDGERDSTLRRDQYDLFHPLQ
jgi:serine/threonine protein kinase